MSGLVKGWSTKYALSTGIEACEVEIKGRYAYIRNRFRTQLIREQTFFTEREDAIANARQQAANKIRSLGKQRAKLELLAIEPKFVSE